jgi:phospholipid transport system substrate-binding protein
MLRNALTALALVTMAAVAGADPALTPNQVVERTAETLASRIEGRAAELSANPPALYALVDEVFLPVFDTDYAGRLVLGKHWRTATPAQRQAFIDAFYDFLLRSYAKYVVRFQKDKVRIFPPGKQADPDRAVVRTEMSLDDGTRIPVNYSLYRTPKGWLAYDVRIEGISYVQNYRNQFNAEISAKGIDAVIARLRAEAAKLEEGQKSSAGSGAGG